MLKAVARALALALLAVTAAGAAEVVTRGGAEGGARSGYGADVGPDIRVNQLGYLPNGPKRATLVAKARMPMPFTLKNATSAVVFEGITVPVGLDPATGLTVQTLDFSAATAIGAGFTVSVDGATSYPFDIRADLYQTLVADAMSTFYPLRSGIEIRQEIAGPGHGRPAGHVSRPGGPEPNQGDIDVPCRTAEPALGARGEPSRCPYTLDVAGGWYTGGGHGKDVVTGSIAAGRLMAAFRRAARASEPDHMRDGELRIPEHGNKVPDVLDEVRWELEWMLKMVVPDGQPLAGMVHHKVDTPLWTSIPKLPSSDDGARVLDQPTTAATLDFAAVAAASARYFARFDRSFIDRMRAAAIKAYAAARAHPGLLAVSGEGGAGPRPDDIDMDLTDEFYWAAAELFVTTGDPAYLADLKASPLWDDPAIFKAEGFDANHVGAFARLLLASEPRRLSGPDSTAIRQSVLNGGDTLLALRAREPSGQSSTPPSAKYDRGWAYRVIQNALVLAAAYDISGKQKYRDAALEAMDDVFGRNALNLSYVNGYGTEFAPGRPWPRYGDSGTAINWNAALAQMAAWLQEQ